MWDAGVSFLDAVIHLPTKLSNMKRTRLISIFRHTSGFDFSRLVLYKEFYDG